MRLRVLGCSGGIGAGLRTTSFLVDDDILIDAGTGVGDLSLEEMARIDHIFLTHCHLDHIVSIPFLVDSVGAMRGTPLTVHGLPETLEALHRHILNGTIWPDFTVIPSKAEPFIRFHPLGKDETVTLGGRKIRPLPADHVVPAIGYHLDSGQGSLVFSGDTGGCSVFWEMVNNIANLRYVLIETAFCNAEKDLAVVSKHLHPDALAKELANLKRPAEVMITHLKPGEAEATMEEVYHAAAAHQPRRLKIHDILEF